MFSVILQGDTNYSCIICSFPRLAFLFPRLLRLLYRSKCVKGKGKKRCAGKNDDGEKVTIIVIIAVQKSNDCILKFLLKERPPQDSAHHVSRAMVLGHEVQIQSAALVYWLDQVDWLDFRGLLADQLKADWFRIPKYK